LESRCIQLLEVCDINRKLIRHLDAAFYVQTGTPKIGKSGGEQIAKQFPNPWQVDLGRVDGNEPGPNRVPALDADVEEIRVSPLSGVLR